MNRDKKIQKQRLRRSHRVRNRVRGDDARPRLSVFRSNRHIYAQLINDELGQTLCSASSRTGEKYAGTVDDAKKVGAALAEKAIALNIKQVRFDRGPYKFHGRIRALADAAREKGLEF
ncbi:MAG: 50S ribosomal protein L18 [Planctomycetota bacterium]